MEIGGCVDKLSDMSIVLVISSLGAGGAERVMTLLAGEWARRGRRVTLITLDDGTGDHYGVPPGVTRVALDVLGASAGKVDAVRRNVRRIGRLKDSIKAARAGVVISFMDSTNVMTLLATRRLGVPVIVSERIDPRHYPIARGWNWLRRRLYPMAAAVVVQTAGVAEWAREFVPGERVRVIANPVVVAGGDGAGSEDGTAQNGALPAGLPESGFIAAMGRLDRQKGFDILLRAYAGLVQPRPGLVIIGEGGERQGLQLLAAELGVADEVWLPGRLSEPAAGLRRAGMFVLSSRFEGFPNALLEAMVLGLPVISFDCASGPADIIDDGKNGLLVRAEDVDALVNAIDRLIKDANLARELGAKAAEVSERFSLSRVTDEWDALMEFVQR